MDARMTPEAAEILGLHALGWLAGEPEALERFLAASGADSDSLRQAAGDPAQLGVILEFLLAQEDLLVRFCKSAEVDARAMHAARHRLEG
jgi:hypothetical protein